MSILQELWYGNINPSEDKEVSDEEKKLVKLMAMHQEYPTSKLKKNEFDEFKKYIECSEKYTALVECQAFETGFKLAISLLTK